MDSYLANIPKDNLPFGIVESVDESRYYGSLVEVQPHRSYQKEKMITKVYRVLNYGTLIEVWWSLDNHESTWRVPYTHVRVLELVDNKPKEIAPPVPEPVPPKTPERPFITVSDLAEHYKACGLDRYLAWDQYVKDTVLSPIVRTNAVDSLDFYRCYDEMPAIICKKNPKYPSMEV